MTQKNDISRDFCSLSILHLVRLLWCCKKHSQAEFSTDAKHCSSLQRYILRVIPVAYSDSHPTLDVVSARWNRLGSVLFRPRRTGLALQRTTYRVGRLSEYSTGMTLRIDLWFPYKVCACDWDLVTGTNNFCTNNFPRVSFGRSVGEQIICLCPQVRLKKACLVFKFGAIGLPVAQPAHRLPTGQSRKIQIQFLQLGAGLLVQRCTGSD